MTRNNRGFTYPLTLAVLIIFLFLFTLQYSQLLSERKLSHEAKTHWMQEYYMITTAKKVEQFLQTKGVIPAQGSIQYQNGIMHYTVDPPLENIEKVTFTLQLDTSETTYGFGFYDIHLKKMVKWLEKN